MKTKEATNILKSIGWEVYKDEVGDRGAYFILPDRIVDIIYGIDRVTHQEFSAMLSLSTDKFSLACRRIHNSRDTYEPLIRLRNGLEICDDEIIKPEHIYQASREAISWAEEQDLHQGILDYAALPTNCIGVLPLRHLAALALLGDIGKLKFYQASFEAGERLGFVPYITKDHIDRAVKLAEKYMLKKQ